MKNLSKVFKVLKLAQSSLVIFSTKEKGESYSG